METLIVQPKTKEQLAAIKAFMKALKIPFKTNTETPNKDTLAATAELKAGKGKKFKDVEALFKSI
jgi:antitoxin component of RelBE/YafQ-DinJ toxin-antitoxin module